MLTKAEPLINAEIEKRRLTYVYDTLMATPEAMRLGIGDVDDARLARAIAVIAESYGLGKPPAPSRVFDRAFLPPLAERRLPR
jgi:NitT/TauT family transport system substrate-binding protein